MNFFRSFLVKCLEHAKEKEDEKSKKAREVRENALKIQENANTLHPFAVGELNAFEKDVVDANMDVCRVFKNEFLHFLFVSENIERNARKSRTYRT